MSNLLLAFTYSIRLDICFRWSSSHWERLVCMCPPHMWPSTSMFMNDVPAERIILCNQIIHFCSWQYHRYGLDLTILSLHNFRSRHWPSGLCARALAQRYWHSSTELRPPIIGTLGWHIYIYIYISRLLQEHAGIRGHFLQWTSEPAAVTVGQTNRK